VQKGFKKQSKAKTPSLVKKSFSVGALKALAS